MKTKSILKFLLETIKLKKVKRAGWVDKLKVKNGESVADHTYSAALMGMIISELKGLDTEKVIKMLLLHDLAEIIIGDLPPEKQEKEKEKIAMEKILSILPKNLQREYTELWLEFEDQMSEEGKLAKQIDKLEMGLQAYVYEKEGYDKKKLKEFWNTVERILSDKELKEFFELLKAKKSNLNSKTK